MKKSVIILLLVLIPSCANYSEYEYVLLKEHNRFIPIFYILGMIDDSESWLKVLQNQAELLEMFHPSEQHQVELFEYYLQLIIRDESLENDLQVEIGRQEYIDFKSKELKRIIFAYYENIQFDAPGMDMAIFKNDKEAMISYLAGVYSRFQRDGKFSINVENRLKLNTVEKCLHELGCQNVIWHKRKYINIDDLPVGDRFERIEFDCSPEITRAIRNYDIDIQL